jgi:arylsulfatase
MFDNTNFPWITSMSTDIPTIGDMMRAAGYYTAYKGKWHLTKEFEEVNKLGSPTKIFTAEMEEYGFSDYFGVGDIIAHTEGGYRHDGIIAAMSGSWLRGKGRELAAQNKPWFLAVNLVNPHDVMFYDTDAPGSPVRPQPGLAPLNRDPVDPLYAAQWRFDLPGQGGPGRIGTSYGRTTRSSHRLIRLTTLAGCAGITTTSTACATWIATSQRCSTNWKHRDRRIAQ